MYYKDGGFYEDDQIDNCIALSNDEYLSLMQGQANGLLIMEDENGRPVLTEQPKSDFHEWNGTKWTLDKELKEAYFKHLKATLLNQISERTDMLQSSLMSGYPTTERESFYRQELEAKAYLEDNTVDCPLLSKIAEMRRIPLSLLCQKVVEKAELLAGYTGQILGTKQHFEDLIEQAKTVAELEKLQKTIALWQL